MPAATQYIKCLISHIIVKNRQCAVPAQMELKVLYNKSLIGSEKNMAVLMLNIAGMMGYIKSLEASIRYFESSDSS